MRTLDDQVSLAIEHYQGLDAIPFAEVTDPQRLYMATPNRLAWALGWIVANQIVQARFAGASIDALPIFHPENGWDRFVITRRVSSHIFSHLPADELGRIMLSGEDAPRFVQPTRNTRRSLGGALARDPKATVAEILERIPERPGGVGDLKRMRKSEQAPRYPDLYATITDLILEHPGLVASREIYIDADEIDGQYHPLHLHAAELSSHGVTDRRGANLPVITYNWFQVQYGQTFAFVDRRGARAVYRTERETWARPKKQLSEEPIERIRERLRGWLRIGGATPDPAVD